MLKLVLLPENLPSFAGGGNTANYRRKLSSHCKLRRAKIQLRCTSIRKQPKTMIQCSFALHHLSRKELRLLHHLAPHFPNQPSHPTLSHLQNILVLLPLFLGFLPVPLLLPYHSVFMLLCYNCLHCLLLQFFLS